MATPVRNLLSPNVLSPKLWNITKNEIAARSPFSIRNQPKLNTKLDFQSPNNRSPNCRIKITITDLCKEQDDLVPKSDLLVNTPIKSQILKEGLDRKKSLNILGRGGFGTVIRAVYKGELVALKVLKNSKPSRDKNAVNLEHDNIVKIIDVLNNKEYDNTIVLMEYLPNSIQLQHILEEPNISMDEKIITYSIDICKGLEHCHRNKILHLDLKPRNIIVCGTHCKICDFGSSITEDDLKNGFEFNGTIHYAAPEILLGQIPNDKSDIYSLGIVFWQMKHRINPYNEFGSKEEIIYKVVKYSYRPELALPVDPFSKLYQKCWRHQPDCRPCIPEILKNLLSMS